MRLERGDLEDSNKAVLEQLLLLRLFGTFEEKKCCLRSRPRLAPAICGRKWTLCKWSLSQVIIIIKCVYDSSIINCQIDMASFLNCHLACSAGLFFERVICSRKCMLKLPFPSPLSFFRPRTYRKGYYFYSPQSSTVIRSKMAATTILRTRTRFRSPKIRLHRRLIAT